MENFKLSDDYICYIQVAYIGLSIITTLAAVFFGLRDKQNSNASAKKVA